MANKLRVRFALNGPRKGGKWAAGELAELSENNRGSIIPLSATWETVSPLLLVTVGTLGRLWERYH